MVQELNDYILKKYTMPNRSDRLLKKRAHREIFLHSYEKGNREIIRGTVPLESPDKFQQSIIYILKLQLKLIKTDDSLK
jgi:hypothetical protein